MMNPRHKGAELEPRYDLLHRLLLETSVIGASFRARSIDLLSAAY
ncbi:hypothetical protein JOE31_002830 [Arthrobacter sp. PvP023]|nr:hypothetical protein [Arthrobacter sp. PvP023]